MEFKSSVMDIIKSRRSVRTYSDRNIEQKKKEIMKVSIESLNNENFRFEIIDFNFKEGEKLGTYGMIKGASTYIIGILDEKFTFDKEIAVDFGYAFEKIVLKATDLDLGTCWMAGTFKSKDLIDVVDLKDEEQIVMVSPLGYGDKVRATEKLARIIAKSDKRKPWEELFFEDDFNNSLRKENAGEYSDVLDMVRIAPSAGNTQPWRILKIDNRYDIYIAKTSFSEKEKQKINVSYNDIGIAKLHFEYSANEKKLAGNWIVNKEYASKEEKFSYVCSWQMNNK
ncbi:nitroreductase family protein [Clostridium sp. DL1XJH146]